MKGGDQLIGRAKLAWAQLRRRDAVQDSDTLRDLHAEVVFSSLDALVTQPEGDFANVPGRLKKVQSTGVAKHVRRNGFVSQRWAAEACGPSVFAQEILEARSCHALLLSVEE